MSFLMSFWPEPIGAIALGWHQDFHVEGRALERCAWRGPQLPKFVAGGAQQAQRRQPAGDDPGRAGGLPGPACQHMGGGGSPNGGG